MKIFEIRMTLLPDNGEHHKLGFADVILGNSKPCLIIRPFALIKVKDGLRVQWPGKWDKKGNRPYLYVEALDGSFRNLVEEEVISKYEAMKLKGALPTVPGRKKNWYHTKTWEAKRKEA